MAEVKVTTAGKAYLNKAIETLHPQFDEDPVINFLLSNLKGQAKNAYRADFFRAVLTAAAIDQGSFQEANDWQAAAVWMPPGHQVGSIRSYLSRGLIGALFTLGLGGMKRILVDYQGQSEKLKKTHLKGLPRYYYLFFIATVPEARGKGLSSVLIKKYQEIATADNVPIWLESTTENSRKVYERCGFEVVAEMTLGKGSHSKTGHVGKGGEGVPVWAMIWKPDALKTKA